MGNIPKVLVEQPTVIIQPARNIVVNALSKLNLKVTAAVVGVILFIAAIYAYFNNKPNRIRPRPPVSSPNVPISPTPTRTRPPASSSNVPTRTTQPQFNSSKFMLASNIGYIVRGISVKPKSVEASFHTFFIYDGKRVDCKIFYHPKERHQFHFVKPDGSYIFIGNSPYQAVHDSGEKKVDIYINKEGITCEALRNAIMDHWSSLLQREGFKEGNILFYTLDEAERNRIQTYQATMMIHQQILSLD
ncbi:MAG: hypothetical protein P0S95_05280 [Rhabdochlamydiaceae bacterium]|nr:hypothetical protein [Candidatus Amphrikana amoebophyrae]